MRLVLANVFLLHVDRLEVVGEALPGVLLGHCFKGVDDDQAVPEAGVDFLLGQSALQLEEHLGSVDDVHLDQIPLHRVAVPAFLELVRLDFEGDAVLGDACDSRVRLIDGEGDDSLDDPPDVEIAGGLGGQVDPASRVLGDP